MMCVIIGIPIMTSNLNTQLSQNLFTLDYFAFNEH